MPDQLSQPEIQQFILEHENDDEKQLVLRHRDILGVPSARIAEQIIGRRKARTKLPEYYQTKGIIFPPGINLEQSSSEATANLKAKVAHRITNKQKTLIDLTGGFGIDSYYFSKTFDEVHYVEKNESLIDVARHNHLLLGATNIFHQSDEAENFVSSFSGQADCVFIDPSRRKTSSQKLFKLSDCEPDIVLLQESILEKTRHLIIKASPLLDIAQGLRELKHVTEVLVIAVDNECKEVLFVVEKQHEGEPTISTINLKSGTSEEFSFMMSDEKNAVVEFSRVLAYLYEPNAALLKAGAFKIISSHYSISKLHPSTHLYTSNELLKDFPGRIFKVQSILRHDSKAIHQAFTDGKANVLTRNYPLRPEELQKKLRLKDGGDQYLLAFTSQEGKQLCHCTRVK